MSMVEPVTFVASVDMVEKSPMVESVTAAEALSVSLR